MGRETDSPLRTVQLCRQPFVETLGSQNRREIVFESADSRCRFRFYVLRFGVGATSESRAERMTEPSAPQPTRRAPMCATDVERAEKKDAGCPQVRSMRLRFFLSPASLRVIELILIIVSILSIAVTMRCVTAISWIARFCSYKDLKVSSHSALVSYLHQIAVFDTRVDHAKHQPKTDAILVVSVAYSEALHQTILRRHYARPYSEMPIR